MVRKKRLFGKKTYKRSAGFTLVEMLVVLGIIGLVMGLVGPKVLNYLSDSKIKTAKIQIENLSGALDLYYLDSGKYPASQEGLAALIHKPSNDLSWNGPYLKGNGLPRDPWGREYIYRSPGKSGPFEIISLGPEGRENSSSISNSLK